MAGRQPHKPLTARQWGKLQEKRQRVGARQREPQMPSPEEQAADPMEAKRARMLEAAHEAVARMEASRAAPEEQTARTDPPPGYLYIGRPLDDPEELRLQEHIRAQLAGFRPLSRSVLDMLVEFIARFERIVPNVSAQPGGEAFAEWRALLDGFRFLKIALFDPLQQTAGLPAGEVGAALAAIGRGGRGPTIADEELLHHYQTAIMEGWSADKAKVEAFRKLGIAVSPEAAKQRFKSGRMAPARQQKRRRASKRNPT